MAAYQERSSIYCVVCSTVLLRSPLWLSVLFLTQEPNKHRKIFWIFIFTLMLLLYFWFRHRNQTSITKSFGYSYSYWFSCCTFYLEKGAKQAFIICGLMKDILRYESSFLILYKELSSTIFQSCQSVSQSVRHAWHPSKSPLFAIYKGMNVLYWPSIINYQLLPPHSVLYWPSTQLHHLVTHSWANWI